MGADEEESMMVELAATLFVVLFFGLVGGFIFNLIIDLIWTFFSFLTKDYREQAKHRTQPITPGQMDMIAHRERWYRERKTKGWFRAGSPASSASTDVGAHRLSGSALSSAGKCDRFRS